MLQCFDAVGWAAVRAYGLWKTEWWGAGMVICLEWGADLHMAQLMPLPLTVSCFSKIPIGFTILVPSHPGSPGKNAVKRVCVCAVTHMLCTNITTSVCLLFCFTHVFLIRIWTTVYELRTLCLELIVGVCNWICICTSCCFWCSALTDGF